MKKTFLTLLAAMAAGFAAKAEVITQWDFNYPLTGTVPIEVDRSTGTFLPSIGAGVFNTIGTVTNSFGNPPAGGVTSDLWPDNSALRLGQFPGAGVGNKTAGVEFFVNTSGYENIRLTWDHENSASASRYWRIQYTTNRVDWIDHDVVIANHLGDPDPTGTPTWQLGLTSDFSAIPEVNNNPDFGIRIVSEFESTATGSGANAYVPNRPGVNYSGNGTLWLDMVIVSGDVIDPNNQPPEVSPIESVSALVNDPIPPIAFTIWDDQTPASSLVVTAFASDTNLISSISLGGSGSDRTITVNPAPNVIGTAIITVRVTDGGGKMGETVFNVTIYEPQMSVIPTQLTAGGAPVDVYFSVWNLPGDPSTWIITGNSSNQELVKDENLVFSGSGTNRILTITPENTIGQAEITVVGVSGGRQVMRTFTIKLLPDFIVGYDLTAIPNQPVPSAPPTLVVQGLSATDIVRGPTLDAANLTRGFSANGFNSTTNGVGVTPSRANALLGDYFEFTVTVQPGYTASFSSIDVSLRRSAVTSPMNYEWLYSFDGFATPGITMASFQYHGRNSGTEPATPVVPYTWMTADVAGQNEGNPIRTMDLSTIPGLQNVPGGTTITFRLIAWGTANSTNGGNTVALGRNNGPFFRGFVTEAAAEPTALAVDRVDGMIRISWPASVSGTLESASSITGSWNEVLESVVEDDGFNTITLPISEDQQFFRLRQ